ncbi:MAG TPA: hypothetical protein VKA51_00535 [Rubrobacteraceae bacterium]|nr:hypothetical protein [Rubrobacteraceae bacterium]
MLPLVGPSVIAALLVTSVLPEVSGFGAELARHAVALLITLAVALRYGNLEGSHCSRASAPTCPSRWRR